jgi:hypothetical protein
MFFQYEETIENLTVLYRLVGALLIKVYILIALASFYLTDNVLESTNSS